VRFLQPDFRGADLTGADLSGSSLKGADFRGALLDGARFASANCEGAWFDEGAGPRADGMPKTQAAVAAGAAIGGSFPMPGEKIATPQPWKLYKTLSAKPRPTPESLHWALSWKRKA
jgi:hypothetical protein